jgi:hypothetical protein
MQEEPHRVPTPSVIWRESHTLWLRRRNRPQQVYRKALAQHPNKGPAAIAKLLSQQHGVPFRAKAISSIKSRGQQQMQAASTRSKSQESVAAMVTNLQAYIHRHGKEDLHRLIDTL